jgi:hypothetical protein
MRTEDEYEAYLEYIKFLNEEARKTGYESNESKKVSSFIAANISDEDTLPF